MCAEREERRTNTIVAAKRFSSSATVQPLVQPGPAGPRHGTLLQYAGKQPRSAAFCTMGAHDDVGSEDEWEPVFEVTEDGTVINHVPWDGQHAGS